MIRSQLGERSYVNFIKSLFGSKKPAEPSRDIRPLAEPLAVPAVHVIKQEAASRSYFGGDPLLPSNIRWPHRGAEPLTFLARLSLSELACAMPIDWLPSAGALLFFYDTDFQPWGFDPKDRGGWAVVPVPDIDPPTRPDGAYSIGFQRISVLPSGERAGVAALALNDTELDEYGTIREEPFTDRPKHQVSGLPSPIQRDTMELECQLVSHGLFCGDSTGYQDPRAASLRSGSAQWRLLFQMDTDDELNVMWGDVGMLYFWVEEEQARAGRFDNVWLVLQCG
jgi:uncharacterized protein YwqG